MRAKRPSTAAKNHNLGNAIYVTKLVDNENINLNKNAERSVSA